MTYKYDEQEKGVVGEYENQHWLENWLRLKVKQEQKEFNDLTREETKQKVRSLTFIKLGLKGKVVIENFPILTQLNLSNNDLEEIIIRNCPDLKLVQVAHNKLTKLEIEGCPAIKEIYTHNNQLTKWDVPVEDLKNQNLRTISYSNNPLTAEEKARLDALGLKDRVVESRVNGPAQEWLDSKYPEDIRGSIEKLDISKLGLQGYLDLEGFTNLKSLDCSDNEITNLRVNTLEKLKWLDCSCNLLKGIELKKNFQLYELYAHNNQLYKLNLGSDLTNLHTLIISENKLDKLDVRKLVNLRKLDCSLNDLDKLDLSNNPKLKTLLCYKNFLSKLEINHLENLECLYCYKNILNELDASGLKNLKELYCANNVKSKKNYIGLKELYVKDCEELKELDCAENYIEDLDISNLPSLGFVSAKENELNNVNASNCPELSYLDISKGGTFGKNSNQGVILIRPKGINWTGSILLRPIKKIDLTGTNNIKEIFFDALLSDNQLPGEQEQSIINWRSMPNLERVEHGKYVLVEEEEEEELLKLLEDLANKNKNINNNSVDTSSSSHDYNLVWIPVLIGQAILLSALIYAYWCDWKKAVRRRRYK